MANNQDLSSIHVAAIKQHRLSLDELAQLRAAQPAFPAGTPDDRWTAAELRAYLDAKHAELAAEPRPRPQARLDNLSRGQLRQVAEATNQAEVDRLLDQFSNEASVT
jgi:hypothetical protein